ncbi:MAG: VWA domain-containing protein [Kiritimatiellae bacterium]|nr:VWA domain-containing protein [Kiritimatiellia bacterium]
MAFSAIAHVGLVRLNPNFLMGSGDFSQKDRPRNRADLQVRETEAEWMKQELPKLLDRFESMTDPLERSESPVDIPEPDAVFQQDPQEELPGVVHRHEPLPPPEEMPEVSPSASEWQPRQEVLAITDQRVRETLDQLPRTFRETRLDRPHAPDISLPGEVPDVTAFSTPGNDLPAAFSGKSGEAGVAGFFGFPDMGSTSGGAREPASPLQPPKLEPVDFESPESLSEMEAVEELLRVETRVYEDPLEPGVRYFKIQLMRNGIESLPVMPRDVVYLLDCSASMTQQKLDVGIEGIRRSLETLGEEDRVNVIAFRETVDTLSPEGVSASIFGKSQVRTFLFNLRARGQTDVFASLNALGNLPREANRPMQALLITDGIPTMGVMDSSDINEGFSRENQGRISMFGLGGGDRVNQLLLDFLGFRNRGASLVAQQAAGLPGAVEQLAKEIRRPVLMNLETRFTGEADVYPRELSHLYLDRPLILVGKVPVDSGPIAFQIIGRSMRGEHDIVFSLDLDTSPQGDASLRKEWAWQALLKKLSDSIGSEDPGVQAELDRLMQTYNLSIPDAYR